MLTVLLCLFMARAEPSAAPADARTRMDEAWLRLDLGDLTGARIVADEAARHDPAWAVERDYLAAVAATFAGEYAEAVAAFEAIRTTWPDGDRARDAAFWQALATAEGGDPRSALRMVRPLARTASTTEDALKLRVAEGTWWIAGGRRARGERRLSPTWAEAEEVLPWFAARAHLEVLTALLAEANARDFDVPERRIDAQVRARTAAVQGALAHLDRIVALEQPLLVLEAVTHYADQHVDLADALLDAPIPVGLSATQRTLYLDGVRKRADEQLGLAAQYLDLGVEFGLRHGVHPPRVAALEDHLTAISARLTPTDAQPLPNP